MTREEMIKYAMEHPFARISHKLFNKDEWLYTDGGTFFYDENGYLFEDWSQANLLHNGLRSRNDGSWLNGWFVVQ